MSDFINAHIVLIELLIWLGIAIMGSGTIRVTAIWTLRKF